MRAILINPHSRAISEIENGGKLDHLEAILRKANRFYTGVERVAISSRDDCWIDGEGMLTAGVPVFYLIGHGGFHRIAGAALILGHDGAGESTDARTDIDTLARMVAWTELMSTGTLTPGREVPQGFHMGDPIMTRWAGEPYLIWSSEHRRWWGPGERGYVGLAEAGRYSRFHAIQICTQARGTGMQIPVRLCDALASGLEGPGAELMPL